MKIYNPITRQHETYEPRGSAATIYVCGVTPYDTTHLGHAFTYTAADILIRYLEYKGLSVRYVQNVTDIDDDVLRKAKQTGEDWIALGNRWTAHFIKDMQALNVRPPDFYPRATEVIPEIVASVDKLVAKGHGYASGGSVYYDVTTWQTLGELSHLTLDEMLPIANQRGNNPDDPKKRHPLDFVLWQAYAPGEPSWESPWGPGRPGWHIECSTMSSKYLGDTIDFHSGGRDLIFPHHECEIAQTEATTGVKPFVRFWMHAAMVRHDGEKMSKSLGNLIMARDLLKVYSPDALRLYLAMHHYQIEWSYDPGHMQWAALLAERFVQAAAVAGGAGQAFDAAPWVGRFTAAMDQDVNSPAALGQVEDLAVQILIAASAGRQVRQAQGELRRMCAVFGLRLDAPGPEQRVVDGWNVHLKKFPV